MFEPLPARFDFPQAELRVLEFWKQHDVFGKSLELRRGAPRFVFYEGPPTANGMPHPGHCLTRAIKDLFPRYKTMRGYLVERKAGWDTHGLPVEVEVCKELGIHSKEEIEAYGVEKFVRRCIESVFRYTRQWEHMTERLGFWINLDEAYVTFHRSYVESVWWSLKTLFDRGLLYQGHKVVWWWAQGGTALSSGEVGEGYRTVEDPSLYVRFPLLEEGLQKVRNQGISGPVSLLVWTTTPWTLISNHFAAVHPLYDYALVHDQTGDEYFYIATDLVAPTLAKVGHAYRVVATCRGKDLLGLRYRPPFDCYYRSLAAQQAPLKEGGTAHIGWRVVPADFVTLDTGTGIVHQAPAYGEVDFELLQEERRRFADFDALPLINAVAPDGTFTDQAPPQYRGRWVKDCDEQIMEELKQRGILFHRELVRHEYPFCPRSEDDPLIQYARKSWFVRTSQFKDEFLRNNDRINWLPEHIREGRFGDFLRNNVDWALSRERWWGTPLPIWECDCGSDECRAGRHREAIGSLAELMAKPGATDGGVWERAKAADPSLPDHLRVHKPYIDAWTYDSPFAKDLVREDPLTGERKPVRARMHRVPEVIDCWWDAGSMPFAQWGFPHVAGSVERFAANFPCDFISEAIDQTRGWFYGLLAISTLLFQEERAGLPPAGAASPAGLPARPYPHPYRTCIVLGHVMGEDGLKMSKRTKNYREPDYIFDHYGADAMRWYFFSAQTPWTSIRFQEAAIRDAHREFLVRLYNVFSFFNIYANIDGFDPGTQAGTQTRRAEEPPASARATGWRPVAQRSEIDRWIISELHRTIRLVRDALDRFENFPAAARLNEFVDALSNWYVRRCRERFWRPLESSAPGVQGSQSAAAGSHPPPCPPSLRDQDKWDAYNTLYEVLITLSRLLAPFTPFFAETMYQNLARGDGVTGARGAAATEPGSRAGWNQDTGASEQEARHSAVPISVHLCDYPEPDETLIDETLAQDMDLVRQIVSTGRAARTAARLKVRQPLSRVEIIPARRDCEQRLARYTALIAEELNVKRVEFAAEADHYVRYQLKPNYKVIGPKFGQLAPQIAAALESLENPGAARRTLLADDTLSLTVAGQTVTLTREDVDLRLEARPGWSAAQGRAAVVVVSTELTPELREEGLVRELIHHVQGLRKEQNLPYEARITLYAAVPAALAEIMRRFAGIIEAECLAERIEFTLPPDAAGLTVRLDGFEAKLAIRRA